MHVHVYVCGVCGVWVCVCVCGGGGGGGGRGEMVLECGRPLLSSSVHGCLVSAQALDKCSQSECVCGGGGGRGGRQRRQSGMESGGGGVARIARAAKF